MSGDRGLRPGAEAVLILIKNEGPDAVLHQSDFHSHDNPTKWDWEINSLFGPDFPYFASISNHDATRFYGSGGYQEVLAVRMNRPGLPLERGFGSQILVSLQWLLHLFSYGSRDIRRGPRYLHPEPIGIG